MIYLMKQIIGKILIVCISLIPVISFWNYLKFTPSWNTSRNNSTFVWKYYCSNAFDVVAVHEWTHFSSCEFYIRYTTWVLSFGSWWWFEDKRKKGFVDNWSWLYKIWSQSTSAQWDATGTKVCATFNFVQNSFTWAVLKFVAEDWVTQTSTSSNWLCLAAWWDTSLSGVRDLTINYEACPCYTDDNPPSWTIWWWSWRIDWNRVLWYITLTWLVYDRDNTHPWYTWFNSDNTSINNYNYHNYNMDNQVWVDSGTIKIDVIYDKSYWLNWNANKTETLRLSNNSLDVTNNTTSNNTNWSQYTWNHKIRWYNISWTNILTWFQIEKPVMIKVYAADNSINWTNVCNKTSTWQYVATYTFNNWFAPNITWDTSSTPINPDKLISFTISDDWAGVNTWSVKLTIGTITSWTEILRTWWVFSWDDLNFDCDNPDSFGWIWPKNCAVTLKTHKPFPTSTIITLTWYVEDYLLKSGTISWNFTTRQDCSEILWCYNPLNINVWSWWAWALKFEKPYTWTNVVVTWTIAPYPYLTWDSGNVLMCGPIDTNINLEWIVIYDNAWNVISTETWYMYSQDLLYVTWLDYSYEWKDGNNENYWLVTIVNNN